MSIEVVVVVVGNPPTVQRHATRIIRDDVLSQRYLYI